MRVLLVEDDSRMAQFVARALRAEGMSVDLLDHGRDVLPAATTTPFDVLILDIMLPGPDGLSLLRQLRARGVSTPVLLLSARGEVDERVDGLRAGADDYLPKPFALVELVARVQALGRRSGETRPSALCLADLTLDVTERIARRGSRRIDLTSREFRLLECLLRHAGRPCTRMLIFEKVWDYGFDPGSNIIDVYIRKLREKIDHEGETKLLHSVRGVGYVMKVES
jgi:two-component system, OmpR family, response regulator